MLKRINHIKKFGIFQNYGRTGNIEDFKKLNIIYGWNYSGKTTISRLFYSLEKEKLHEDYPDCEFELTDQNDNKYSEKYLTIHDKEIRVFNSDFIHKNLKWNGEAIDPILLLGEESIEAEKQIENKKQKVTRLIVIIDKLKNVYQAIDSEIENGLTNKASEIKTKLSLVEAFTKTHLKPILSEIRQDHSSYKIDEDRKEKKLLKEATVSEDDKLPKLDKYSPAVTLTSMIEEVKVLVKEVPELSETIDYFRENPEIAEWVEKGLPLHEDKDTCEYCGSTIKSERKEKLLAHFSEDLKNHKVKLSELEERILNSKLQALENTKMDFYQALRNEFDSASTDLKNSIKDYNKQLDKLQKILQTKKEKPFESISDLTSIIDCCQTISEHIDIYNEVVGKNNDNTDEFDENKSSAIKVLKKHYTADFIDTICLYKKESKISLYQNREEKLLTLKGDLETEIQQIEAQISNAQKGREKLNKYIHSFLGHKEIEIFVQDDDGNERFILKRGNDKALNLSEGEKTAVAFSFFLTKLIEIEDLKTAIVYIDDPISSLDSNHIFQINALLREFFLYQEDINSSWELNCEQLFLSTHNFDFFTLLRELPLKKEFTEYYFVRRIDKIKATLERLPKAIRNYTSEYHYLFSEIYKFHNSENKNDFEALMNIPNAVRRFVELYTYSKIPGNWKSKVDDRTDKLFGKEKSKRIMKVLHYFSHSNDIERMSKNNELICDIENAVNDLMVELQNDKLHFEELKKSIQ